jgi:hypothetical protein
MPNTVRYNITYCTYSVVLIFILLLFIIIGIDALCTVQSSLNLFTPTVKYAGINTVTGVIYRNGWSQSRVVVRTVQYGYG